VAVHGQDEGDSVDFEEGDEVRILGLKGVQARWNGCTGLLQSQEPDKWDAKKSSRVACWKVQLHRPPGYRSSSSPSSRPLIPAGALLQCACVRSECLQPLRHVEWPRLECYPTLMNLLQAADDMQIDSKVPFPSKVPFHGNQLEDWHLSTAPPIERFLFAIAWFVCQNMPILLFVMVCVVAC
jgi:hypothetical protein